MNFFINKPTKIDKTAKNELEELFGKHDGHISRIVVLTLWFDFVARYAIALLIFIVIVINYFYIHNLLISKDISAELIMNYTKYSTIFGSALLIVLAYWFSGSGASSILKEAAQAVNNRRLQQMINSKHKQEDIE